MGAESRQTVSSLSTPNTAMSAGMRHFPPPSPGLGTRLGDVVGLVVVAGHDGHRLGQRLEPGRQLNRVVVPEVGLRGVAQRRERIVGVGREDRLAKPLVALVRPYDAARAVEREVAESFLEEIFGPHAAGAVVGSRDVGNRREPGFEILGYGQDAVLGKELHTVRVVELPDHGIGLHAAGAVDHGLQAEAVADREGQPTEAPGLARVVGIACDAEQQAAGIGFGKVGQKDDACHVRGVS